MFHKMIILIKFHQVSKSLNNSYSQVELMVLEDHKPKVFE